MQKTNNFYRSPFFFYSITHCSNPLSERIFHSEETIIQLQFKIKIKIPEVAEKSPQVSFTHWSKTELRSIVKVLLRRTTVFLLVSFCVLSIQLNSLPVQGRQALLFLLAIRNLGKLEADSQTLIRKYTVLERLPCLNLAHSLFVK